MNKKVIFLAVLVMLLWGSLFPFIKIGYKAFDIDTSFIPNILLFAGVRFIVCGGIISAFSALKKNKMRFEIKKEMPLIMLSSLFGIILHYICTYTGLAMADSSVTALLKQIGVFIFIPFSFLFFKEDKFKINNIFSAVCGFAGIAALSVKGDGISLGTGEMLVIAASLCSVASGVVGKNVMKTVNPVTMTGYSQIFGGIVLTAIGIMLGGHISVVSLQACAVFCYICTASIFGYCIWNYLVKNHDLSRLFIIKFLEPVFAAVFGAILLGEDIFNIRFVIALLLTGAAIVISQKN